MGAVDSQPRKTDEAPAAEVEFGPLPSMIGYQIRQAQTAVFRDFAVAMADLDISPGEFSLLTLIDANPGASQTRLTSLYKVDKSTMSLRIGGLVNRGLVRRSRSKADQRYYALWLAEPGRRLLGKVRRKVDRQEQAMDAVLQPGERERLLDMLKRLARAFDP